MPAPQNVGCIDAMRLNSRVAIMYCAQCGTLAVVDAKFCSKCGSPMSIDASEKPSEAKSTTTDVAKPRKLWLYIVGVLLVGTYAAMFLPAFGGQKINPQSTFSSMLWTGLFFYLWWKRRARKGWHGALVGSALGLLVSVAAEVIAGLA